MCIQMMKKGIHPNRSHFHQHDISSVLVTFLLVLWIPVCAIAGKPTVPVFCLEHDRHSGYTTRKQVLVQVLWCCVHFSLLR